MVGVFCIYVAAHATGIGQAADILMLLAGGNNTRYEEFRAFCRQHLYEFNGRPSLEERRKIWEFVNTDPDYKKLPQGKNPFPGNK